MRLKDKLNLFRRYPHWSRRQCIFVHVPKAAGTSINRALYGRTLGHYTAAEIAEQFPALFRRCFVFAFVRNPWDRVLSAYRFAVKGRTEAMGMRNPEQYRTAAFASFETFISEWLVRQDVATADFVFRPQHLFVENAAGETIVDYVGRLESIEAELAEIESRSGFRLDLKHDNRTAETASYRDAYLNKAMIDTVARIYSRDIEKFDYDF